jgi:C-terminal processing protease CtpA/Prc
MAPLRNLWNCALPNPEGVLNFGGRNPIFTMPAGFTQRLGRNSSDFFFSGTYSAGGYKIGFIRIPNFSPSDTNAALNQFAGEIIYFNSNTDGLIIDDMRNPGGSVSYLNTIASMVIPYQFRAIPFEVRATSNWVVQISSAIESAKAQAADGWIIALLGNLKSQIDQANSEYRGRTGPIPIDDVSIDRAPLTLQDGTVIAYNKPVMVLVDDFSASAGDAFPATLQDNNRALIVGYRTMGAGGNVFSYSAGTYSEGATTLTQSLMNRKNPVIVDGYPAAPYVENLGVQPDVVLDYMTKDNLLQNGKPFVDAFTAAMVNYIKTSK